MKWTALALSIATVGLIIPVTVRATPNAKDGKFTLVAGAHRLRVCIINELEEIDAVIIIREIKPLPS